MYRSITRRSVLNSAAIGGAVLALDACTKKPVVANKAPMDKVTFLTGFGQTPRECYAWVGKGMKFFTDQGIDLDIVAGQPSDTNLKTLAAGKAWFGAIDWVSAVRGISNPNYSYRAFMAVQHNTLLSMITLPGRGINGPKDLAGTAKAPTLLGTAASAATQTLFPAYASSAGIDTTYIKFVNIESGGLPAALVANQIRAMGAYAVDTPGIKNAAKGAEPIVLPYGDRLTDLYGTVIVVRKDIIDSKPDLVSRFASAMWRGIKYAVDNPTDAGALVHAAIPTVNADTMKTTMELMAPSTTSPQFEAGRVARSLALLQQAGLAPSGLSTTPERVVDFSFAPKAA